jgi:hypothetical protein
MMTDAPVAGFTGKLLRLRGSIRVMLTNQNF